MAQTIQLTGITCYHSRALPPLVAECGFPEAAGACLATPKPNAATFDSLNVEQIVSNMMRSLAK